MKVIIFTIIVIGIPLFFLDKWSSKKIEKDRRNKIEEYKKEGLEYIGLYSFKCLGGFKDIGACKNCFINLFKDRIRIKLYKEGANGEFLGSKEVEVMIDDIVDTTLENESKIIEKVSLGKMAVFGLLSLGMQGKEKEIQRELLILSIKHEDNIVNLVLTDSEKNSNATFKFLQEVNSLKNESETES